jgi:YD repeat-containing protein
VKWIISLYDQANRLVGVTQGSDVYNLAYLGTGDRIGQTVNGVTTTYALDLTAGLTQVLSDGANTYLYGNGRIAQMNGVDSAYTTRAIPGDV